MPEDQEFTTAYPSPEISLNRPGAFQNGITLILQSESKGNMGTNDTLFTLIGGNTSVGEHEQLIRWRVKDGSNAYEGVEIARHDDTNLIIKPSYNEHYTLYTWIYQAIGDSISVNRYHINNEGRLINEYIYNYTQSGTIIGYKASEFPEYTLILNNEYPLISGSHAYYPFDSLKIYWGNIPIEEKNNIILIQH